MTSLASLWGSDVGLLRLFTAGSVDDGKSTLIGRLLYDSKAIFEDQVQAMEKTTVRRGGEGIDLSLLTDGLIAEREQGITIDVAYRYFATPRRKFIIADTPGHEQYTRNMVTGASTANLAIILVDARSGVVTQTRRHTYISSLLGIPHVVLAVNKMDLVGYSQEVFKRVVSEFRTMAGKLGFRSIDCLPISALLGDCVVDRGENLSWYTGPTLIELLETIAVDQDINQSDFRFPVQYVCKPQAAAHTDFRGYMGRVESGEIEVGEEVVVFPSEKTAIVEGIYVYPSQLTQARAPQSVTLVLDRDLDISRGDILSRAGNLPQVRRELVADVCWFSERSMDPRRKYLIKHSTQCVKAQITRIQFGVDIDAMINRETASLVMNDLARIEFKVQRPIFADAYRVNRATGSFIVIDEATNDTAAAGMIVL
jgi:sulfate adenylyltransferase subunit 1